MLSSNSKINPKLLSVLMEFRQALQDFYGDRFVRLVLYGSQARNEATADSDVDLLLVLQAPVSPASEIFRIGELRTQFSLEHDLLLSVLPISDRDYQNRNTPLLHNIRCEGLIV